MAGYIRHNGSELEIAHYEVQDGGYVDDVEG